MQFPASIFISSFKNDEKWDIMEIKKRIESHLDDEKISAMKNIIIRSVNFQFDEELFIPIFKFIMPTKNKFLIKLLLVYLEQMPKVDRFNNLRSESILLWYFIIFFSNAVKNYVNHPNEYIRFAALRFISTLDCIELIEPLLTSVYSSLVNFLNY